VADGSVRRVVSKSDAEALIRDIPDIPMITTVNDKLLEQEYKTCMKSNNCHELVKVIKTIYSRKKKRIEAGRKVTAVDAKYFRLAEDSLYGELAVALGIPKKEVESFITADIDGKAGAEEKEPQLV
jgi:CarD family transcriptional regulator